MRDATRARREREEDFKGHSSRACIATGSVVGANPLVRARFRAGAEHRHRMTRSPISKHTRDRRVHTSRLIPSPSPSCPPPLGVTTPHRSFPRERGLLSSSSHRESRAIRERRMQYCGLAGDTLEIKRTRFALPPPLSSSPVFFTLSSRRFSKAALLEWPSAPFFSQHVSVY